MEQVCCPPPLHSLWKVNLLMETITHPFCPNFSVVGPAPGRQRCEALLISASLGNVTIHTTLLDLTFLSHLETNSSQRIYLEPRRGELFMTLIGQVGKLRPEFECGVGSIAFEISIPPGLSSQSSSWIY